MNLDEQSRGEDDRVDSRWLAFVCMVAALAVVAFYLHHAAEGVHAASGMAHERILVVKDGT